MVRNVYVNKKRISLSPSLLLGQGGEAEVFDVRSELPGAVPLALKVWMPPEHAAFAGTDRDSERNRQAAAARIREYGAKLREFPKNLPPQVVQPRDLAVDSAQSVVGYTMALIEGAEPLRVYGQRHFRMSRSIESAAIVRLFRSLHGAVRAVHQAKVVIGDFNYLNVLVRDETPHLIDVDSFQFGKFACRGFTTRFVDPLICDGREKLPVQAKPHSILTDWYAYALMLFECLMLVGPYGGVYRPKKKAELLPEDARPLRRISVFHPEVIYPQKAQPLAWLPKRVSDFYGKLLVDDWRGEFPPELLEVLLAHAEGRVVAPATFAPNPAVLEVLRGAVRMVRRYDEPGAITSASLQDGQLALVRYHQGHLLREDGTTLLSTPLDPLLECKVSRRRTLLAKGGVLAVLEPGETPLRHAVDSYQGRFPVFDTNARHYYWLDQGMLYRDDLAGPRVMGTVLKNQTRFWVGPQFGVGYSRAGGIFTGFVFDAERCGINDTVKLPKVAGEIIDATCYFSSKRAWLFLTLRQGASVLNRCLVIRPDGSVSGMVEAPEGSGSWLGSIRGKCAATAAGTSPTDFVHRLYSITDEGLVGVDDLGGDKPPMETVKYADTKTFLEHDATLLSSGSGGVLQVVKGAVWQIAF